MRTTASVRAKLAKEIQRLQKSCGSVHNSVYLGLFPPLLLHLKHKHPVVAGTLGSFARSNLRTVSVEYGSDV